MYVFYCSPICTSSLFSSQKEDGCFFLTAPQLILVAAVNQSTSNSTHRARIPSPLSSYTPLPLRVAKSGRNNLNEEFMYPPPPHWERREILTKPYQFRTCSALAPMWTPPINESAELTGGPLVNSLLWDSTWVRTHFTPPPPIFPFSLFPLTFVYVLYTRV